MKFIDDLYDLYKDEMVGDEEDAVALVMYMLQDQDRDDLLTLIDDMSDDEIYQMVGQFLIEKLKAKMVQEGLGQHRPYPRDSKNIH